MTLGWMQDRTRVDAYNKVSLMIRRTDESFFLCVYILSLSFASLELDKITSVYLVGFSFWFS
jgi:hypothetical protein